MSVLTGVAFAQGPAVLDSPFQVGYAANLDKGDSWINIINDGANGASQFGPGFGGNVGNICVNVYAFTSDEEMVSCCSCPVTPDQLVHLGVGADILGNLTHGGAVPSSLTIKLLATLDGAGGSGGATDCNNSAAAVAAPGTSLVNGMVAFRTTLHTGVGPLVFMTETPFLPASLSTGELNSLGSRCTSIIGNLSGFGVCGSCSAGAEICSVSGAGWAVGNGGTIVHTSNGGATWSPQTSGTGGFLFGVSFVDANNGWAVGEFGTLLHTSNGGATWAAQTSGTGNALYGVSFVDANNGGAVGLLGTIVHTSNGGATWSAQTSGTGYDLYGVSFVDANNGWAVGNNGTILHTSNGGATWSAQTSGTTNFLEGVSFVDANNGWAVGDGGVILHTSNGGAAWSPQTSSTGALLLSVNFVDANNGWAVGTNGTIVHTSNGGATWSPQTSGTGNHLPAVRFVYANNGWAVGDNGTIRHTSNGGGIWSAQTSGTANQLFGVSFVRTGACQ